MDDPLAEQIAYYRRRAPVYDQWWTREGHWAVDADRHERWAADTAEVERLVRDARPTGRILELAAGTGLFTRLLAEHADHVTAVDASPEVLGLNAARLPDAPVDRVVADVFSYEPPAAAFDVVAFTYWLSHVPDDRLDGFWDVVGRSLAPGGRVLLVDSPPWPPHDPPPRGARPETRTLPDGSTHTVVKRYWRPGELADDLAARGWSADVGPTRNGMILHAVARRP